MDCRVLHSINDNLEGIRKQLSRIADVLEGEGKAEIKRPQHESSADEAKIHEITEALDKLGALNEYIELVHNGERAKVYLDGEYFGIYDFVRRTFVD